MSAKAIINGRNIIYKDNQWVFEDTGEPIPNTDNVFRQEYRELTQQEKDALNELKDEAARFYTMIDVFVHEGREKALAKTKLEESVMWAVKGITK